jgi:hypothetical protein
MGAHFFPFCVDVGCGPDALLDDAHLLLDVLRLLLASASVYHSFNVRCLVAYVFLHVHRFTLECFLLDLDATA